MKLHLTTKATKAQAIDPTKDCRCNEYSPSLSSASLLRRTLNRCGGSTKTSSSRGCDCRQDSLACNSDKEMHLMLQGEGIDHDAPKPQKRFPQQRLSSVATSQTADMDSVSDSDDDGSIDAVPPSLWQDDEKEEALEATGEVSISTCLFSSQKEETGTSARPINHATFVKEVVPSPTRRSGRLRRSLTGLVWDDNKSHVRKQSSLSSMLSHERVNCTKNAGDALPLPTTITTKTTKMKERARRRGSSGRQRSSSVLTWDDSSQ